MCNYAVYGEEFQGSTKTRNPESGIRKRNHGNGNGNKIWERGIQEINFKISNNNMMMMMMMMMIHKT